jgi:drug/metabolite transporter (DMT)-like permease
VADETKPRCSCARCRVRGLMGPVMLIVLGVIFLMGEYTSYNMGQLWPVLLIVAGVVLFAQTVVSKDGHTGP